MEKAISSRFCTLSMACFLLVSVANCSPSQFHHRFRREATSETIMSSSTSPDSSSMSPSTPSSASVMMSHEGHKISCDDKDNATLKTTCPNSDMCPSDMETLEKCCHCIGTCCETTVSSGDSTESSTEDGKKNFGSKVKDAVSSAEGWLKNQGQNIKQGWDKAKEGIKNTATEVKDKVKKGVDSMTSKFRNGTGRGNASNEGTKMECSDKDGNCSTDMPSSMGEQMATGTQMPMTPAPGNQKNKRDVYGAGSPSLYQTHYSSFSGGRGDSDTSDSGSDEYSWSKSSKTTTGNRDSTNMRRYKREMSSKSNSKSSDNSTATSSFSSTSTPEKASRTKRESKAERTSSTEPSNPTETSTGKNSRNKRGDDRRSDSNSGSLPAVKTSTATTVTEGTVTENGKSSSSSSTSSTSNRSRNRREGKNNKDGSTTPSSPGSTTGSSSNETESNENSKEDGSFHRGSKYEEEDDKTHGKDYSRRKDPKLAISVQLGPPKHNGNSRQSKIGKIGGREGDRETHRPTQYPIISSGGGGRTQNMEASEEDDDSDVVMEHPPVVFPDSSDSTSHRGSGGVVFSSASASSSGNGGGSGSGYPKGGGNKGQYETEWVRGESDMSSHYGVDLSSYPMMLVNSGRSMLTSPSGMWRHENDRDYDNHGHGHDRQHGTRFNDDRSSQYRHQPVPSVTVSDGERSRANRSLVKMDMETDRNSSSSGSSSMDFDKKPGMCRPLAVGVDCVFLQAHAPQCSYDEMCPGPMKCCFNACEPYNHVGICDDSVFS